MKRYIVEVSGLFATDVGEDSVTLQKEIPKYSLTDNLQHAKRQQRQLEKVLGKKGEMYSITKKLEKRIVRLDEFEEDSSVKYYVFENDKGQAVKYIADTGDIALSFQEAYEMTRVYQVTRVLERLGEYGLDGYFLTALRKKSPPSSV